MVRSEAASAELGLGWHLLKALEPDRHRSVADQATVGLQHVYPQAAGVADEHVLLEQLLVVVVRVRGLRRDGFGGRLVR